jgi:hypothetical protein
MRWIVLVVLMALGAPLAHAGEPTGTVRGTMPLAGTFWVYVDGDGPQPLDPPVVEVLQTGTQFSPNKMWAVVQGTTVQFKNNGPELHNVYSASSTAQFDLGSYRPTQSRSFTFDEPGVVPVRCNMHAWMKVDLLVVPNLWYAETVKGSFDIPGVAAGDHQLVAWNPKVTLRTTIHVEAGGTTVVPFTAE